MAKKIRKLYKTTTVTLGEEDVEIRAYRPGDGPLVRAIMVTQIAMEKLAKEENTEENHWKMFDLRLEQEEAAVPLAQRGVKRAIIPDAVLMTPEELDELDNIDLDPDDMVSIAWAMINMGLPSRASSPAAGADTGKKKPGKKSAQKSTGKTTT